MDRRRCTRKSCRGWPNIESIAKVREGLNAVTSQQSIGKSLKTSRAWPLDLVYCIAEVLSEAVFRDRCDTLPLRMIAGGTRRGREVSAPPIGQIQSTL